MGVHAYRLAAYLVGPRLAQAGVLAFGRPSGECPWQCSVWEGLAPLVVLVQVVAGVLSAPVTVQAKAVALLVAEEALLNLAVAEMFSQDAVSSLPVFLLPSKKSPNK